MMLVFHSKVRRRERKGGFQKEVDDDDDDDDDDKQVVVVDEKPAFKTLLPRLTPAAIQTLSLALSKFISSWFPLLNCRKCNWEKQVCFF